MTNSVTFPVNLGGDGSTVTDDDNASTGLGNGGHRTRFVPAMGQVVAVANTLTQRLAEQSDTSTTSLAIATGSKSFVTAGFYEWAVGMYVVAASTSSPANRMYGQVTSWTTSTNTLVVNVLAIDGSGTFSSWTVSLSGPPNLTTLPNVISVNSTTDALRITQLGTGNALLVEDSSNPDANPFAIDQNGNVINGHTSALAALAGVTPQFQLHGTTNGTASGMIARWSADANPSKISLAKSRGASPGTYTIVASGDDIGAVDFLAANGTAFIQAAQILVEVDATPGAADMPGRLVFSTTADGASSPTERMRLDSSGNLGLGVTPSAWGSTYRMQQIGYGASVGGRTAATQAYLSANWYQDGTGNKYIYNGFATQYQQDSGGHYWFTAPSGTAGNAISFTQAMTLDASGSLLVGTTSSAGSAYVLQIKGGWEFKDASGVQQFWYNPSSGFVYFPPIYNKTTANAANVHVGSAPGDMYRSTSALKYKQDIRDIESIDINKFRPVRYRSKCENDDQSKDHFGIIADEVLEAGFPELVIFGADGEPEGFQYERLTAVLVKTVQDLSAELNELKKRIN